MKLIKVGVSKGMQPGGRVAWVVRAALRRRRRSELQVAAGGGGSAGNPGDDV